MLRTNSKAVMNKVRDYIIQGYQVSYNGYNLYYTKDFDFIAYEIATIFYKEYVQYNKQCRHQSIQRTFVNWLQGLPHIIDTNYFLSDIARLIVTDWLEETEEEKNKYTESQAEDLISYLIFKALEQAIFKVCL